MGKKLWKRFICFMNRYHDWISKERFYSRNGISGIYQYKIVCKKCDKGNKEEWKENGTFLIVN
jgi:hypothetical protein